MPETKHKLTPQDVEQTRAANALAQSKALDHRLSLLPDHDMIDVRDEQLRLSQESRGTYDGTNH